MIVKILLKKQYNSNRATVFNQYIHQANLDPTNCYSSRLGVVVNANTNQYTLLGTQATNPNTYFILGTHYDNILFLSRLRATSEILKKENLRLHGQGGLLSGDGYTFGKITQTEIQEERAKSLFLCEQNAALFIRIYKLKLD